MSRGKDCFNHDIGHGGTSLLAAVIRQAVLDARQGNFEAQCWLDSFFPEWRRYESRQPAKRYSENHFDFSKVRQHETKQGRNVRILAANYADDQGGAADGIH